VLPVRYEYHLYVRSKVSLNQGAGDSASCIHSGHDLTGEWRLGKGQWRPLVNMKVVTAVTMKNVVFWDLKPSSYFTGDTLRLRYRAQPVNAM
jgi:hypothetical protein